MKFTIASSEVSQEAGGGGEGKNDQNPPGD